MTYSIPLYYLTLLKVKKWTDNQQLRLMKNVQCAKCKVLHVYYKAQCKIVSSPNKARLPEVIHHFMEAFVGLFVVFWQALID